MNSIFSETLELKKRSDIHFARKFWHFFGVMAMLVLHNNLSHQSALLAITVGWLFFVPVDVMRLYSPALNQWVVYSFQLIMRKNEEHRIAGTSYLLTGVFIILLVFPKSIVALALMYLGFADPVASYFGVRYGKDKVIGDKTIQGTVAAFIVCTLVSISFYYANNIMVERIVVVSILSGIGGALAELIPVGKLDDNLTLPVLSATWLYFIFQIFGGLS